MYTYEIGKKISYYIGEIQSGKSIEQVAKKNGIKPNRLKAALLHYGEDKGKQILLEVEVNSKLSSLTTPTTIEDIRKYFEEGLTTEEIARKIGMDENILQKLILDFESITGSKKLKNRMAPGASARTDVDFEEIIMEYMQGETISSLAKKYEVASITIRRKINEKPNWEEIDKAHKSALIKKENAEADKKDKIPDSNNLKIATEEKIREVLGKNMCSLEEVVEILVEQGYTVPIATYNKLNAEIGIIEGDER